jgi:hypothetical protein
VAARRRLLLAEMIAHRRLGADGPAAACMAYGAAVVRHRDVERRWRSTRKAAAQAAAERAVAAAQKGVGAAQAVVAERAAEVAAAPTKASRFLAQREQLEAERAVAVGLGRIVALYSRSSTLYKIH